ncbi:LysR family transcriptional regulator [Streptomyces griseorubiginosus]|uniref:LysR family transcriptional regulator n=1 Tax=Streptomyces griseorubiginosus TaxID=67304 RepID=A0A101RQ33_9ACTN|nr:LysR family transcriptional regulator [Streptomyces griseorubiginosus]KUN59545.1 LysR family transcriptional regulator [Streptomyces griseorubiginosus]
MEQLDLNLLRIFDALVEEGSVTAAAERLHLSIPATSRALGRLRRACGDPVLVRAGRGMLPTPYAMRAAPRVRSLLDEASELLRADREIRPAELRRTFTIRINDGVAATLAPALVAAVAVEAPGVVLRFVAELTESVEALRDGSVDLDVGVGSFTTPDICTAALYQDRMVAAACAGSPLDGPGPLTLARLCAPHHVSASRRGQAHGPLDDVLSAAGLHRHVAAVVPTYAAALLLVSSSPYVGLVPRQLAEQYGPPLGLRWFDVPAQLPELHVRAAWHPRLDNDPEHRWLRDTLQDTARASLPR